MPGHANNQSNVSVFTHGGRLLSSGEVGWPYELDPATLATVGPYDYGGRLATAMTAHPKVDPATGDLHFFGYGFVPRTSRTTWPPPTAPSCTARRST